MKKIIKNNEHPASASAVTGHMPHTGHTRALETERESQVTHDDLVHMLCSISSTFIDMSFVLLQQHPHIPSNALLS